MANNKLKLAHEIAVERIKSLMSELKDLETKAERLNHRKADDFNEFLQNMMQQSNLKGQFTSFSYLLAAMKMKPEEIEYVNQELGPLGGETSSILMQLELRN